MDTDRVELTAAGIGAPGPLKTMYEQMVTSKRSHRLGRQHRMDLLAPPRTTNDHTDEVATWRRAHGYDPTQRWDPVHGCSRTGGPPVEYVQLSSSTFVCAGCGWAHVCGEGCGERQIDSRSDLLVCPISGRCFDRLLTNREVCGWVWVGICCMFCCICSFLFTACVFVWISYFQCPTTSQHQRVCVLSIYTCVCILPIHRRKKQQRHEGGSNRMKQGSGATMDTWQGHM